MKIYLVHYSGGGSEPEYGVYVAESAEEVAEMQKAENYWETPFSIEEIDASEKQHICTSYKCC